MKTNKLILTLFPVILFVTAICPAASQNLRDYSEIAGKVIDAQTDKGLAFASVGLSSSNISNVTNSDGYFSLKIPFSSPDTILVKVSFVGYASVNVPLSDFYSAGKPLRISLIRTSLTLDPSMIRPYDAAGLFDVAFGRIKSNYPQENVSMTGFYRERILKGSRYLALSEAVVDIAKAPYSAMKADHIGIFKGRGSKNYDSTDTLFIKLQGGPVSALDYDIVKNPFVGVYLRDAHICYDFGLSERVTTGGRDFYVIAFDQKASSEGDSVKDLLFRGRIYIDSETFAIGRIDAYQNVEGKDEAAALFVKNKPAEMRVSIDEAHYVVNYKLSEDGKWYLDYVSLDLSFTSKRKGSLFKNHFSAKSELAVTDHKAGDFDIAPENRLKPKDVLSEKVVSFTDENFWGGYNIIEPDKSIDKIVGRIVRQLQKRESEK